MATFQKFFVFCFFAFAAICTQDSNAQSISLPYTSGVQDSTPTNSTTADPTHPPSADPTHPPSADPTHPTTPVPTDPTGNPNPDSTIDLSSLPDGMNVIAETRGQVLMAVIMEKGRMTSMGSIDPKGNFHKFELNAPCGDYLAAPCRDGSKPSVYFDPYLKECVGVCDNDLDLDPAAYNPITPYGLLPNGPCSDYIAQPCRKGTTLVMYYNPYTKTCTSYCDY